nr:MAG TPA: hypothetical protein [Caudoviricetes sp.]
MCKLFLIFFNLLHYFFKFRQIISLIRFIPVFNKRHEFTTSCHFFRRNEQLPYRHVKSTGNFLRFFHK